MNKHATRLLTGAALAAIPLAGAGTAQADTLHPDPVGDALGTLDGMIRDTPAGQFLPPKTNIPDGASTQHTAPETGDISDFMEKTPAVPETPATPTPSPEGTVGDNTPVTTYQAPTVNIGDLGDFGQSLDGDINQAVSGLLGNLDTRGLTGDNIIDPLNLSDKFSREQTDRRTAADMHTEGKYGQTTGQTLAADDLLGQWTGTATLPNQDQIDLAIGDAQHLIGNIANGQVLRDVQTTVDDFLQSDSFLSWADNTDNPFAQRNTADYATPVDRAADGIQAYIDSISRHPVETLAQTLDEAGGVLRVVTDPLGAITDVLTKVAGPEFVTDLTNFITNDLIPGVRESLEKALPALAIPLATAGLGGLLGLVGSTLLSLPLMAGLPLLGSSIGSALALVILSTITYGIWLLTEIPVAIVGLGAGVLLGLVAGVALAALAGFNPLMIPAAIGGGLLVAAFVFTMIVGGYTLLTFLIPTIAYLLLSPLFLAGGAGIGGLLGLGLGTILAGIIIPAGTLGGAALGGLAGIPVAAVTFAIIALTHFNSLAGQWGDGPLGRVLDALNKGWETSSLRHVFDDLKDIWSGTDTGKTLDDLGALMNQIFAANWNLDGDRLRDIVINGGVFGALLGALASLGLGLGTGIPTALATFIPNLILLGLPWLAIVGVSVLGALAAAIIPPLAIAAAAWIIGSLAVSAPLWIPLTLVATVATLIAFLAANPAVVIGTGGLAGGVAGVAGTISTVVSILDVIVILGALLIGLPIIGIPVFAIAALFFIVPALATQIPALLSLGSPILMAAGLSLLEGALVGISVAGLSSLVTVPAGATIGAVLAVLSRLSFASWIDGDTLFGQAQLRNNGWFPPVNLVESVPTASAAGLGASHKVSAVKVPTNLLQAA